MIEDLRYTLRQFRKSPGFTFSAVVTLALGIGATAAMFGLIQAVLLSPPPYGNPSRLVFLSPSRTDGQPYANGVTIGQWVDWRNSSRTVEAPALYRWTFNFLILPDGSESLGGMVVSSDFFRRLGVRPVLGREFVDSEAARPKVPPTAVIIGHELWKRRFNSSPDAVGQTLRLSRYPAPLPIVGVMPPGLRFLPDPGASSEPNYDVNAAVDFWLLNAPDETQVNSRGYNAVTRMRDGVTLEQAQAEVAAMTKGQAARDARLADLTVNVRPLLDELNRDGVNLLAPLFGFVVLVFFIACVNVAGLFVARGLQRHREYAMRAALGAGRARMFRQVITESVALSMVSAMLGAALALGIISVFKVIGAGAIPRADAVTIGWPMFAFGFAAALVAAIVSGVAPALRASSPAHMQALKGARSTAARGERRLLGGIATVQIVLTVALLSGAALLIRTAINLANVTRGYDIENILAVTVTSVTPDTFDAFHTQVLDRVAALPGVSHAAFAWGVPLTGNKWPGTLALPARPDLGQVGFPMRSVTPDYFALMGMQVLQGRTFAAGDTADARRVIIVNEAFARKYFPGSAAVGQQVILPGDKRDTADIVGLVADTRTDALSRAAEPEVYFSFWQNGAFSKHLVVRAGVDPRELVTSIRREVHAVDPTASVEHAVTMDEIRRQSLAPNTFAMRLLIGFSVVATALALVGIYGVLSLSVGSRLKEIAVRKAIGAQHGDIMRATLGEGGRMIVVGVLLGAIVAVWAGRALQSLLFDVPAADMVSVAAASVAFGASAFAICLLPAIRAARTDLVAALHQE